MLRICRLASHKNNLIIYDFWVDKNKRIVLIGSFARVMLMLVIFNS